MSTDTTPPPVGTIMKWNNLRAEVLLASPEYMVVRDRGGCLRALQHVDGEWLDAVDDVWEIEALKGDDDPPIPDRDPETFPPRARREVAISAWVDRLTALEAVVEEMNRRLCDAEDEIDELELAQPDPVQASDLPTIEDMERRLRDAPVRASDLPTLPVGTVLKWWPYIDRTVVSAAPGFALTVNTDGDKFAIAWINGGWRTAILGGSDASADVPAWEVQP